MTKAYKLAKKEIENRKYFHIHELAGLIGTLVNYDNLPLTQDLIDNVKLAVCDVFCDGIDIEFVSDNHWQLWEGLNPESFVNNKIWNSDSFSLTWAEKERKLL